MAIGSRAITQPAHGLAPAVAVATAFAMALSVVVASLVTGFTVATTHSGAPPVARGSQDPSTAQIRAAYDGLPVTFEPNIGQAASDVQFLTRAAGTVMELSRSSATWALQSPANATGSHSATMARMDFVGSDRAARIAGEQKQAGVVNYFRGSDPSLWHTNVSTFGAVRIHNLYPGIDVLWHGTAAVAAEYDFIVAPGADPSRIHLHFSGARSVRVDESGNLLIETRAGELREATPHLTQTIGASRQTIAGGYVVEGRTDAGLRIGAYDHTRMLVIDPTLSYSTYLGGSQNDRAYGVAVDSSGYAYVTGRTISTDFPVTKHSYDTSCGTDGNCNVNNSNPFDVFVTKFDRNGTRLVYSTYLGGSGVDQPVGIAVDAAGQAYVAGNTQSGDFPTTPNSYEPTCVPPSGFADCAAAEAAGYGVGPAFVTELNESGSALVYSSYFATSNAFAPMRGLALGPSSTVYLTGQATTTDFPVTSGAFQSTCRSATDCQNAFVSRLAPLGHGAADLLYSTFLGGTGGENEAAGAISVDADGNAYVTGDTWSNDFPVTSGALQTAGGNTTNTYLTDAFLTILDPAVSGDGSGVPSSTNAAVKYSTYLGGSGRDAGFGVSAGPNGSAYVAGSTQSADFRVSASAAQSTYGGGFENAFVTVIRATGRGSGDLAYSTYLGGNIDDEALAIVTSPSGLAYVAGSAGSATFPVHHATQRVCGCFYDENFSDAFLAVVDPAKTGLASLPFSTFLGGNAAEQAFGVAADGTGNAYIAGYTFSPLQIPHVKFLPFPTTHGAFQRTYAGNWDAFVSKWSGLPS